MSADVPDLMTLAMIADLENAKLHRLVYIVKKLQIRPAFRFGNCDVYSPVDVAKIRGELTRIDARHAELRHTGGVGDDSLADAKPAPAVVS